MNALLTITTTGLVAGGVYAILGVCAVFTYRLVAVVNLTGAAIGATGAFTMVALIESGMPQLPAIALGLTAGTLVAAMIGFVMTRWFSGAPGSTKAAVTAALLVGMIAFGLRLTGGQDAHLFPDVVAGSAFQFAGVQVTNAAVVTVVLAAIVTFAAETLLSRTRTGLYLRALSERPMTAGLMGVPVNRLAMIVWVLNGAITTLALIIIAPQVSPNFASMSLLIVPALAAALMGSFSSFRTALVGGLLIGVVEGLASGIDWLNEFRGALPFAVILAALLWSQRGALWDEVR